MLPPAPHLVIVLSIVVTGVLGMEIDVPVHLLHAPAGARARHHTMTNEGYQTISKSLNTSSDALLEANRGLQRLIERANDVCPGFYKSHTDAVLGGRVKLLKSTAEKCSSCVKGHCRARAKKICAIEAQIAAAAQKAVEEAKKAVEAAKKAAKEAAKRAAEEARRVALATKKAAEEAARKAAALARKIAEAAKRRAEHAKRLAEAAARKAAAEARRIALATKRTAEAAARRAAAIAHAARRRIEEARRAAANAARRAAEAARNAARSVRRKFNSWFGKRSFSESSRPYKKEPSCGDIKKNGQTCLFYTRRCSSCAQADRLEARLRDPISKHSIPVCPEATAATNRQKEVQAQFAWLIQEPRTRYGEYRVTKVSFNPLNMADSRVYSIAKVKVDGKIFGVNVHLVLNEPIQVYNPFQAGPIIAKHAFNKARQIIGR